MHKKELVEAVAQRTGKSQKDVKETLEAVISTINDKKLHPQELIVGGQHNVDTTLGFQADLTSRTDYYPFGMEIQSRSGVLAP